MKVFVVLGKNNLLESITCLGVTDTLESAEIVAKAQSWCADEIKIFEREVMYQNQTRN